MGGNSIQKQPISRPRVAPLSLLEYIHLFSVYKCLLRNAYTTFESPTLHNSLLITSVRD